MAKQNSSKLDRRIPTFLIIVVFPLLFGLRWISVRYDVYYATSNQPYLHNHTVQHQNQVNKAYVINTTSIQIPSVSHIESNYECSLYLIKNHVPKIGVYHYYHDWECIISAFHYQMPRNESITRCSNITFIVSEQYNYSQSQYFNSKLFNFEIIKTEKFMRHMKKRRHRYQCGKAVEHRYRMVQFKKYLIAKYKLNNRYNMGYENKEFYKDYGDVLVVNRKRISHRSIYNVQELMNTLNKEYMNSSHDVRLVYFENMSLINQYESLLNASVIITPHGATETNLFMINHMLMKNIKIIELCPPYLHCSFICTKNRKCFQMNSVSLCPFWYKNVFRYLHIYAIAREDIHLGNCDNYWKYQKWYTYYNSYRNFPIDFKNVISFKINVDDVIKVIRIDYSDKLHHGGKQIVYIHRDTFNDTEFKFYASNTTLVIPEEKGFDLYP